MLTSHHLSFVSFRGLLPASLLEPVAPPPSFCTRKHAVQLHTPAENVPGRGQGSALPGGEGQREGQRARAFERRAEAAQRGRPDAGRKERGGPPGEERRPGERKRPGHGERYLVLSSSPSPPSPPPAAEVALPTLHSRTQIQTVASSALLPFRWRCGEVSWTRNRQRGSG